MSFLPVYVHSFSYNIVESFECRTFDHCTIKCECTVQTILIFPPWNFWLMVGGVIYYDFWNHFCRITVESSNLELSTMVRANAYAHTGNIGIQSHHGRMFRMGTFDHGVTISSQNFRPVVRGVIHQVFWNHFSYTLVQSSNSLLLTVVQLLTELLIESSNSSHMGLFLLTFTHLQ